MIAFSHLGKYGKLGNQLFQIAVVYSHCIRNGKEFSEKLKKHFVNKMSSVTT